MWKDKSPAGQKPFLYVNESYEMNDILNSNPSCFCIAYVLIFYSNQIVWVHLLSSTVSA